jgi:hypothetical protein
MDTPSLEYQSTRLDCAQASLLKVRSHYIRLPTTIAVTAQLALVEQLLDCVLKMGTYMTMLVDGHSNDVSDLPEVAEFCRLAEEMEAELTR